MPILFAFYLFFGIELKTMGSYPLCLSEATTGAAGGGASGLLTGLLSGLFRGFKPSSTHMNYVDRCLREKGYEVIGWNWRRLSILQTRTPGWSSLILSGTRS